MQAHFDLLNTHLESTKDHAEERKVQLKYCLDKLARLVMHMIQDTTISPFPCHYQPPPHSIIYPCPNGLHCL